MARPAKFPGAVALAIGLSLSGKRLGAKVRELSDAGYVAVVYKSNGTSDEVLRAAARDNGMALFRASDSAPWNQLAEIMDAAVVPHRQSGRTLVDIRPGDLFDLANTVAAQAGGAIAIADPEQTILAYSTLPDQPIDETRRSSILSLQVPHSVETDNDYRRVHAATDALDVATQDPSLLAHGHRDPGRRLRSGLARLLELADHHNEDANRILREAANVAALHILHKRTTYVSNLTRQIDLVQPLLFDPKRAELAAIRLGISAPSIRVAALGVGRPRPSRPKRCSPASGSSTPSGLPAPSGCPRPSAGSRTTSCTSSCPKPPKPHATSSAPRF